MNNWTNLAHDPEELLDLALPYAMRPLFALSIFIIGRRVLRAVVRVGPDDDALARRADPDWLRHAGGLYRPMALVVIAALSRLGVDTTSAAARRIPMLRSPLPRFLVREFSKGRANVNTRNAAVTSTGNGPHLARPSPGASTLPSGTCRER